MSTPTTSITTEHRRAFEALRDPTVGNLALISCFIDGTPTAAIVAVTEAPDGFLISPLFVAMTDLMHLTGHDGAAPRSTGGVS